MTLGEAAGLGVARLRKPYWALAEDVIVLDIYPDGTRSAWATLLSPMLPPEGTKVLLVGDMSDDWEAAP